MGIRHNEQRRKWKVNVFPLGQCSNHCITREKHFIQHSSCSSKWKVTASTLWISQFFKYILHTLWKYTFLEALWDFPGYLSWENENHLHQLWFWLPYPVCKQPFWPHCTQWQKWAACKSSQMQQMLNTLTKSPSFPLQTNKQATIWVFKFLPSFLIIFMYRIR